MVTMVVVGLMRYPVFDVEQRFNIHDEWGAGDSAREPEVL